MLQVYTACGLLLTVCSHWLPTLVSAVKAVGSMCRMMVIVILSDPDTWTICLACWSPVATVVWSAAIIAVQPFYDEVKQTCALHLHI